MIKQYCILIHYHEISLKGKNRRWFERLLIKNIKKQLNGLDYSNIILENASIICFGINKQRWKEYASRLESTMGIKHATLMTKIKCEISLIKSVVLEELDGIEFNSFRISTKRQYKQFDLTSQQVNELVGEYIQEFSNKPVSLKNPQLNLIIELVKGMAYIGHYRVKGYGGLPVGSSEHAVSMISSGIDSPVASFEMLRRGVHLTYIHFHSMPVTNRQSIKNVQDILMILSKYQIKSKLFLVPILEIQRKIMSEIPDKFWVILFRRAMFKITSIIAENINAPAIVSGESVGQVASQTLSNIRATANSADRPVLRPLCGMNKEDIINQAQKLGTYDISIEPYEDCCSFFVPPHPETKANLNEIIMLESKINFGTLIDDSIKKTETSTLIYPKYIQKSANKLEKLND
tara:strand:- start:557 stop:1771 length:1215 start_codon:yes stop_codon:yes gene_type:complete